MHFDLTDEHRALQAGIRELCAGRFTTERVRSGFDREGWRELGDAGVFGVRVPEERGGLGLGTTHAVVVLEEVGRALVPGPVVAQCLAAALVDGAVDGRRVVGLVHHDPAGARAVLVEHPDALDDLLVLRPEAVGRAAASDLAGAAVARPLDPLTPLRAVPSLPEPDPLGARVDRQRIDRDGAVLTAALEVGIAQGATDLAVAYAKQREQFGKPIGTFQAVKHLCAEMLVRTEVARAALYDAAVRLDDPDLGGVERSVAGAKLLADEAALHNGKDAVQVHGGMGFTWEVDAHLYLKRAAVLRTHFGETHHHEEVVARSL